MAPAGIAGGGEERIAVALERPGAHRAVGFVVALNSMPGRRMRWTFTADNGLTETGVTSSGVEAAFKAGLDAAEVAIDLALDGKSARRQDRKKSAKEETWTTYSTALDALKDAIAAWAYDSSVDNLVRVNEAQRAGGRAGEGLLPLDGGPVAMCGRYKIEERWQEYCKLAQFDWNDPPFPTENPFKVSSEEVRPTDRMPIVRLNEQGKLIAELRRWGFILMVDGKTIDKATGKPKKIKRDVINAMSEKLTSSYLWKWSFKERRCLIPMSSWDEWPETGAGKQRVRISMPSEPVFMAAGLFDAQVDPKSGQKVDVYTMCTVPPNEFLGTVHDRAPMVLLPDQYRAWLDGGVDALALVGTHPDADAFAVQPV